MSRSPLLLPFAPVETTLPNGLRVIAVNTGMPNIVWSQISVQTGSRNEVEPGKSGFAHFFEHMMFRGTPDYPPERYQQVMAKTGARQNAYTTDDYTNYHATFAAEDIETVLALEADRFQHLRYSEADFKTEARAVLGEYNKSSANPMTKLFEVQREHAYRVHTYQHTTMGFLADIEDMPNQFEYSLQFFQRWYRPEYTTVLIAGDVDADRIAGVVDRHFGSWERGSYTVHIPTEPEPRGPVVAHVPWPVETLPWVTVAFHGPALSEAEPDFAALDMALDLHFGETSDLYRRLVEKEQKVDQLLPYAPARRDPALATAFARVKDPADAPYVRDAIIDTFAAIRDQPVGAQRLEEAKAHNRNGFLRGLDNTEAIASALAQFVHFRRTAETLPNLFRQYDRLTPDDLVEAARTYLTPERLVQTTLSHDALPPEIERIRYSTTPAAGAVSAEDVPAIIQEVPAPFVRVKLQFGAGSAHDPAGKEGMAALAAAMIADAGSRDLAIDEINRRLFPYAAGLRALVDKEMTTFTAVMPRETVDTCLDIMLPQLTRPGFRTEDFDRLKTNQLHALVQDLRTNNEEELGKEALQAVIFRDTPYGHPVAGTVAGLESISLDDVKAFVARQYTRHNLTLGISGEDTQDVEARLRAAMHALPAGEPPSPLAVEGEKLDGRHVYIIDKESRSTAFSLGHPIHVTRAHPDFAALWLARAWLGEHRASHGQLFQRIREVRGLNYGDYAYIEAFPRGMYQFFPDANIARRAQIFEIWIRPVVPANAPFSLKLALYELERLITNGLTPEEFEETRDYLRKNVFLMTSTQEQRLGYALDSRWYGIGDFVETMRDRLNALTVDDVNAAIRKHLSAEDIVILTVAGNARELRDQLLSSEPATIVYDAEKPAELLEEDRIVGACDLRLSPERITTVPVDEVFAR